MTKGGFQTESRLASAIEEIAIEARAARSEAPHKWHLALVEIEQLAAQAAALLARTGRQPVASGTSNA